jgi:hypothetical protein
VSPKNKKQNVISKIEMKVKNDKETFMKNKNDALTSLEPREGLRPENLELIRIK